MTDRITSEQLEKIIAEVDQISRQREEELNRQQVEDILQQLNLSPDLLDDAMIQIQRREALAKQQRRNRWIGIAIAILIIGSLATTWIVVQNRQHNLAQIVAYQSRLTLSQDNGGNLTLIERQQSPEIYYRVTLQDVPIGKKLSLKCNWMDPSGKIAHENSYQTRTIDKRNWNTHCRYQFGTASVPGTWKVQMILGDKILSSNDFTVK